MLRQVVDSFHMFSSLKNTFLSKKKITEEDPVDDHVTNRDNLELHMNLHLIIPNVNFHQKGLGTRNY